MSGLLSPSARTAAGHRQYTSADFERLQQILTLKFLGFSLHEISHCLRLGPASMRSAPRLQKAMLEERRSTLERTLRAISYAEAALENNSETWQRIVELIRLFQVSQQIDQQYYSEEQRQRLASWGQHWTEADQQVAGQRWEAAIAELTRLVAEGADPAGPCAQALAHEWHDLVQRFTHGDQGIERSLARMYNDIASLPAQMRPFSPPCDEAGKHFIQSALAIYQERSGPAT